MGHHRGGDSGRRSVEERPFAPIAALVAAAALLGAITAAAPAPAAPAATATPAPADSQAHTGMRYVAILTDPQTPPNERELWAIYLYTRAALAASESDAQPLPLGVRAPSFEGEVRARRVAVGLFRKLERDDPGFGSRYFDDLDRVESAGFMREYVWRYLKQPSWSAAPPGLQLTQFDAWRAVHLRYHVPETHGSIAVKLAATGR
ncbi:MAG TPA: hypothetical protein VN730_00165 [Steroidobacteraceae bacterium]|nr:hypothetical protein [Steroidobacteraceae bacterium]